MKSADTFSSTFWALAIAPLPSEVRKRLLLDETFMGKIGLKPEFSLPLNAKLSVNISSLHSALRKALEGAKNCSIQLKSRKKIRVRLGLRKDGSVTLGYKNAVFNFSNASLLTSSKRKRKAAMKRLFSAQPLTESQEQKWFSIADKRPFTDAEFDELSTTVGDTPEALFNELLVPQEVGIDEIMPDSAEYYDRLVASPAASQTLPAFINNELRSARESLLRRAPAVALRRIALSALSQPLIPFDLLAQLDAEDLLPLLGAEDPFTLLFGFEICRSGMGRSSEFIDLGTRFLEKLLGDLETAQSRCEIYAACAIISLAEIRRSGKCFDAPVFWKRLASLSHAGVLTDAFGGMPETKTFFKWASEKFGPSYIWSSSLDRFDSRRWRPDWISPDHLLAELVGRVFAVVFRIPEGQRPAQWDALARSLTPHLESNGMFVAAFFPGPFDDFRDQSGEDTVIPDVFAEIEEGLQSASSLDQINGLVPMVYWSSPKDSVAENILRIVNISGDAFSSDSEDALRWLKVCAHVACVKKSEKLSDVVVTKCLEISRHIKSPKPVTDIFSVIIEACTAKETRANFRKTVGENAAKLCCLLEHRDSLENILSVLDVLVQYDEKLLPCVAKAQAIARTRILRM